MHTPSPERRRVGLLGGTFDPIHIAHLIIAEEVRTTLNLDEMVFIPAGQPPHKLERQRAEPHHRLAMVELAIKSNPHFTISRIEIDRPGPSYTADTLRLVNEQRGTNTDLYFVIGGDSLADLHTWYNPAGILAQLTGLVAVQRPGYTENIEYNRQLEARLPGIMQRLISVVVPQMEISSTDLRRRVAEDRPIKYQVPDAVEQYIRHHGLYQITNK
jgi:nicotinate-nucleotide adenylyltransferase